MQPFLKVALLPWVSSSSTIFTKNVQQKSKKFHANFGKGREMERVGERKIWNDSEREHEREKGSMGMRE